MLVDGSDGDADEDVADNLADESAPAAGQQETDETVAKMDPKNRATVRNHAMRFMATPSLGSTTTSIRIICSPVFDLMYDAIDEGGAAWETRQYAKQCRGLRREYRGTNGALCKLEDTALTSLQRMAVDTNLWEVVLPEHRTVDLRNDNFQLVGALACGVQKRRSASTATFHT